MIRKLLESREEKILVRLDEKRVKFEVENADNIEKVKQVIERAGYGV